MFNFKFKLLTYSLYCDQYF